MHLTRRTQIDWALVTSTFLPPKTPCGFSLLTENRKNIHHIAFFTMSVSTLVKAQWLRQLMLQKTRYLRVLDASWHLPKENRDPKKEFEAHRIPGAKFFDIEECVDKSSPYDHMLPNTEDFSNYVRSLGIKNDSHVIVYDNNKAGLFSAPRVWWMFRAFGHDRVSLLDGGFPKWCAEGYPVKSGPESSKPIEGNSWSCRFKITCKTWRSRVLAGTVC